MSFGLAESLAIVFNTDIGSWLGKLSNLFMKIVKFFRIMQWAVSISCSLKNALIWDSGALFL